MPGGGVYVPPTNQKTLLGLPFPPICKVVTQDDHLMDAMRYLIMSGRARMRTKPQPPKQVLEYRYPGQNELVWMNWGNPYGQRTRLYARRDRYPFGERGKPAYCGC